MAVTECKRALFLTQAGTNSLNCSKSYLKCTVFTKNHDCYVSDPCFIDTSSAYRIDAEFGKRVYKFRGGM